MMTITGTQIDKYCLLVAAIIKYGHLSPSLGEPAGETEKEEPLYTSLAHFLNFFWLSLHQSDLVSTSVVPETKIIYTSHITGLFPAISGKAPGQNWEKMINLTAKLGEINDIEHNKGSKIYPQVILDCIMPSIPLKHKCLSIILIWFIVSHK